MSIALDLIVILIIVFTLARAIKAGFITTLFDAGKLIASIILAAIFKTNLSQYIMNTDIFENAKNSVTQTLTEAISGIGENISVQEMLLAFEENNPTLVKLITGFGGSMEEISNRLKNAVIDGSNNVTELAAEYIIEPAASVCSDVISFAIIFVVAFILLCIAQKLLNLIFKLPLLKQINKLAGALLGVICAFLYVSVFCFVITSIIESSALFGIELPANLIEDTYVFSFFSDNGLISLIKGLFI